MTRGKERNTSIFHFFFSGDRIWCETVEDLSVGTELVASFIVDTQPSGADRSSGVVKQEPATASDGEDVNKTDDPIDGKSEIRSKLQLPAQHGRSINKTHVCNASRLLSLYKFLRYIKVCDFRGQHTCTNLNTS